MSTRKRRAYLYSPHPMARPDPSSMTMIKVGTEARVYTTDRLISDLP